MKGVVSEYYLVNADAAVTAIRGLQAVGLAARLDVSDLSRDESDSMIVVQAHSGHDSPSGEFQRELMDTIEGVLDELAPGYRHHSGGITISSALDLRRVVDPDGNDLGFRLWAHDADDAERQLDRIAEYSGLPRQVLFVTPSAGGNNA